MILSDTDLLRRSNISATVKLDLANKERSDTSKHTSVTQNTVHLSLDWRTFACNEFRLEELWNVENDAEGEDGDDVGGDPLADSAGVCEVPVGVRMADGAVSGKERPGNFICRTGFSRKCFFC